MKIAVQVLTKKGNYFDVELPSKMEVCHRCDGKGAHVNPNVDGHGISSEEFDEDPDFRESYFRGDYDVTCEECNGKNVVAVVDEEQISKKMLERYHNALEQRYADYAEAAWERKWCC